MEHSKYNDSGFYALAAKKTGKIPKGLVNKPPYSMYSETYIGIFYRLCSSRSIGMTQGCIPVSEVTDYFKNYETPDDDIDTFLTIIQELDSVYLENLNKSKSR